MPFSTDLTEVVARVLDYLRGQIDLAEEVSIGDKNDFVRVNGFVHELTTYAIPRAKFLQVLNMLWRIQLVEVKGQKGILILDSDGKPSILQSSDGHFSFGVSTSLKNQDTRPSSTFVAALIDGDTNFTIKKTRNEQIYYDVHGILSYKSIAVHAFQKNSDRKRLFDFLWSHRILPSDSKLESEDRNDFTYAQVAVKAGYARDDSDYRARKEDVEDLLRPAINQLNKKFRDKGVPMKIHKENSISLRIKSE